MAIRPTGQVATIPRGSLVLTVRAAELLGAYLETCPPSMNPDVRAIVADVTRLSRSRHMSRDTYQEFLEGAGQSELTTNQAAARLGISPGAVRKRISRGYLPATFDGKRWLINEHDLEERIHNGSQ